MDKLTYEHAARILQYDPATGQITRIHKDGAWRNTGGLHRQTGYLVVGLLHRPYLAHRLAFLLMTGAWPADQVDHINGVRVDNRWVNLRAATSALSAQNKRSPQSNNTQQLLGVSHWSNRRGAKKYVAQLSKSGTRLICSYHYTAEAAHQTYLTAKRQHHEGNTL